MYEHCTCSLRRAPKHALLHYGEMKRILMLPPFYGEYDVVTIIAVMERVTNR